jgi:hypothetical protein
MARETVTGVLSDPSGTRCPGELRSVPARGEGQENLRDA